MSEADALFPTLFRTIKCLPQACPSCRALFDDAAAFDRLLVGDGKNYAEALVNSYNNMDEYRVGGFIICRRCENKTFQLIIDQRTVEAVEEARLLIRDEGFTYWEETLAGGGDLATLLALIHAAEEKEREQRRQALVEIGFE